MVESWPVTICDITQMGEVKQSILDALTQNAAAQDPGDNDEDDTRPVVLIALNLKHWHEFEKNSLLWTAHRTDSGLTVHLTSRGDDGYWRRDDSRTLFLQAPAEELAERLASMLAERDPRDRPVRLLGGPPAPLT